MTIKILMPALSPTMTEGNLSKWLVKKGDKINAGDVIAEIETDKATMELEAVDEGMITDILVKEGSEGIAVNTPIAVLDNKDNLVNTAGYGFVGINSDRKIVNKDWDVSYIVHQYDRFPESIKSKLSDKYDFIL